MSSLRVSDSRTPIPGSRASATAKRLWRLGPKPWLWPTLCHWPAAISGLCRPSFSPLPPRATRRPQAVCRDGHDRRLPRPPRLRLPRKPPSLCGLWQLGLWHLRELPSGRRWSSWGKAANPGPPRREAFCSSPDGRGRRPQPSPGSGRERCLLWSCNVTSVEHVPRVLAAMPGQGLVAFQEPRGTTEAANRASQGIRILGANFVGGPTQALVACATRGASARLFPLDVRAPYGARCGRGGGHTDPRVQPLCSRLRLAAWAVIRCRGRDL